MAGVLVDTSREAGGSLLVATARGGAHLDPAAEAPLAFASTADGPLLACLCDGTGDRGAGMAASRVAARAAVVAGARPAPTLAAAITAGLTAAHAEVTRFGTREAPDDGFGGGGAACSAVLIALTRTRLQVGWVGGLEAIVLRDGQVVHRTAGHSLARELAASGRFTLEELAQVSVSHGAVLTRALGTPAGRALGIDLVGPWSTEPGDLVVLCSAHIHRVLAETDLTALASRDDIAVIARGLVTTAATRGEFSELFALAVRVVAR